MNILCAFLMMIICIILVLIELKIFNRIEVRMRKKDETNFNPQYKGYIVLNTILIFILITLWLVRTQCCFVQD